MTKAPTRPYPEDADRPLDGLERTYFTVSQAVKVNAQGFARVRGPLAPEHVRAALDVLQRRHPLLRVHVEGPPGPMRFVTAGTGPIPLRVLPRHGPEDWRTALEDELALGFDAAKGPLVRAVHLHGPDASEVLMTLHHGIGDGLSIASFFKDLFTLAAEAAAGKQPSLPPLPAHPPMSALNPIDPASKEGRRLVRRQVRSLLWTLLVRKPVRLQADGHVPLGQRRTVFLERSLERHELDALRARAKEQRTTVTGALVAAMATALAEDHGRGKAVVGCSTPVGLRHLLPPGFDGCVGYLSWGLGLYPTVHHGAAFWDLAREMRADLERQLAAKGAEVSLALTEARADKVVAKGAWALVEQHDKHYPTATAISNIGVVDAPERYGAFEWVDLRFGANADSGGPNIGASATTFRGRLNLNFVYPAVLLKAPRAEHIADRTVQLLRDAAAHPDLRLRTRKDRAPSPS